jgi:hypothetical protein
MHTFVGFPDDLGYDMRVTSVDHANRKRSDNQLKNLNYRNSSFQAFNRGHILEKYDVDDVADLPVDIRAKIDGWVAPPLSDVSKGHLEERASAILIDVPFRAVQKFLRNETVTANEMKVLPESLFMFSYPELEHIYETSDWVFPFSEWKKLDASKLIPRVRVESIVNALNSYGEKYDTNEIIKDDLKRVQLQMLFNRVYMYHHYNAFGYPTQYHNVELSKKRKREE